MATIKNLKPLFLTLYEEEINIESLILQWLEMFEQFQLK